MKKKYDKASLLTTGVVVLLCIFFVGGFAIGLNIVMDMEGNYPPVVNEESVVPAPETAEEALAVLNEALDKIKAEKPKTDTSVSYSIDSDSIETDGSDQFMQSMLYVKDNVESYLEDSVEKPACDFYGNVESILRLPEITPDQISEYTCDYKYYQCSSCGKTSDEPLENCEDCGNERPYDLRYTDNYRITLTLVNDEAVLNECFAPRSQDESLRLVNEGLGDKAKLDKIDTECTDLAIYFEVNRLTDKITYLSYRRGTDAEFDATDAFTNDWSKIKGGNVNLHYTDRFDYSFTWPALTLSDHYMSVEPKGNENLLATLTCDDPTAYDVTWKSSDESIVTVDDEGYFDATKKTGKAVITASYEFGGITYSDECEIEVKVPIERLSMNHKKVSLKVGETAQLAVKFKPADSTIQTVKWYTEDESVATVDADGTVHAVAPGKVTVYCLSDDSYFKSSSEVTVE